MSMFHSIFRTLAPMALGLVCLSASAQWQWLDKDGRKVFSDRAPPSDVPDKSILKRPGNATRAAAPAVANADGTISPAAAASAPEGAASAPKLSGVDKELVDKKKLAEKQAADAEATKRKTEEERVTKAKAENCASARQSKATLDSGVRIGRVNAKGEREYLDDAGRAAETKRAQGVIDTSCK